MAMLKASDVGFEEVTYVFVAECDDCGWNTYHGEATVKDCRDHVRMHGHSVIRTKLTGGRYYPLRSSKESQ